MTRIDTEGREGGREEGREEAFHTHNPTKYLCNVPQLSARVLGMFSLGRKEGRWGEE